MIRTARVKAVAAAIAAAFTVACSFQPPTEPAPFTITHTGVAVPTPSPEPPVAGPTPTPAPTPAPAPPVIAVDYYDAETGTAHWFGAPLFGDRFVIEVWRSRGEIWLHGTRLPIVHKDPTTVIAADQAPGHTMTATLNLTTGQWTFSGLVGSGGGTLAFRESR